MKLAGSLTLSIVALLAVPATSQAGTGIGATCDSPSTTLNQTLIQKTVAAGDPSYTVPQGGGVITAWAVRETSVKTLKMKLFRSNGIANQFVVAAESEPQTTTGTGLNEFKTRIPVQGDEILGLTSLAPVMTPYCLIGGTSAASTLTPAGDPGVGSTVTLGAAGPGSVLDIAALVEPDADKDGFGDESQDYCPTEATGGAACVPVDRTAPTISGKAPKLSALMKKSKISATISSNEAATATASGTLSVPGAAKSYSLKPVSVAVAAGGKAKLTFKVPRKGLKALRKRKKATLVINVSVKDAAGNASTGKFTSKLKITNKRRVIRR